MNGLSEVVTARTARASLRRTPSRAAVAFGTAQTEWLPFAIVGVVVATLGMRVAEFAPVLAVVRPIILVMTLAWLTFVLREGVDGVMKPFGRRWTAWLAGFVGWAMLTVPFAVWRGGAFATVRDLILTVSGAWLILALPRTHRSSERLQLVLVGAACLFAALVLLLGGEMINGRYGAAIGMDVNDIALIAASCFPLAVGLALRRGTVGALPAWFAAALLAAVVVRSGSRGGALAIIAGSVILMIGSPWRRSLALLLIGGPLAFGLWTQAPAAFRQRMTDLFAGVEDYNETEYEGRKQIWSRGIRYGLENPVFGIGPNGFVTYDGMDLQAQGRSGKWNAAHSLYVQTFAELGIPGALLYLALFAQLLRVTFRRFRKRSANSGGPRPEFLAALLSFAVGSAFLSFLYYPFTWLFFAASFHMADAGMPGAGAGAPDRRKVRLSEWPARRARSGRVAQPLPAAGLSAMRR